MGKYRKKRVHLERDARGRYLKRTRNKKRRKRKSHGQKRRRRRRGSKKANGRLKRSSKMIQFLKCPK